MDLQDRLAHPRLRPALKTPPKPHTEPLPHERLQEGLPKGFPEGLPGEPKDIARYACIIPGERCNIAQEASQFTKGGVSAAASLVSPPAAFYIGAMMLRLPFLKRSPLVSVVRLNGAIGMPGRGSLSDAALAPS